MNDIRLGHALGNTGAVVDEDTLKEAIGIATGSVTLNSRVPRMHSVVITAETYLNATPRPIYAYLGDLHPELGCIGLIFKQDWSNRSLQGVSRCDSGGLVGRFGGFCALSSSNSKQDLLDVSYPVNCSISDWKAHFNDELLNLYADNPRRYVEGIAPDITRLTDIRKQCIQHAQNNGPLDRRLWTWELRMSNSPIQSELRAIVLSPQMNQRLLFLISSGTISAPPGNVDILTIPNGVSYPTHWFNHDKVREYLLGVR